MLILKTPLYAMTTKMAQHQTSNMKGNMLLP